VLATKFSSFIEFRASPVWVQRNSGFPYSDINAIIGKDQSGVGGGKLGVGHLDGRLESETTDLGEGNKMLVVERKTESKRS
jgi:hypothetical protein